VSVLVTEAIKKATSYQERNILTGPHGEAYS